MQLMYLGIHLKSLGMGVSMHLVKVYWSVGMHKIQNICTRNNICAVQQPYIVRKRIPSPEFAHEICTGYQVFSSFSQMKSHNCVFFPQH